MLRVALGGLNTSLFSMSAQLLQLRKLLRAWVASPWLFCVACRTGLALGAALGSSPSVWAQPGQCVPRPPADPSLLPWGVGTHRAKNNTEVSTELPPWLLSTLCSVKVIKIPTDSN